MDFPVRVTFDSSGLVTGFAGGARATDAYTRSARGATDVTARLTRTTNEYTRSAQSIGLASIGMQSMARQLAGMAAGWLSVNAAIRQVQSSVSVFAGFQLRIAGVAAVSEAAVSEIAELREQALKLGDETLFTATQVAQAQEQLARAGFSVTENLAALPRILELAIADEIDLATASDVVSGALRGFHIEATDAARVTAALGKASLISRAGVTDMGVAISYVAPTSHSLGVSLEDTAAAMAVLADNSIAGSRGGTTLAQALGALIDPAGKGEDVLTDLGVSADQFMKTLREGGLVEALRLLEGIGIKEARRVANTRGGPGLQILVDNIEKLAENRKQIGLAADAVARMASLKMDTLWGSFRELESAVEGVQIRIGEGLEPQLRDLLDEWTAFFRGQGDEAREFGANVGESLGVVSAALMVVATNLALVKAVFEAWLLLKVAGWLQGVGLAALAGLARWRQYEAGMVAAAAAQKVAAAAARETAIALEIQEAILATHSPTHNWLESLGIRMTETAKATDTATTKSKLLVTGGLTPLAIGLAAVAGVLLIVNDRLKDLARVDQLAIESMVHNSDKFFRAMDERRKKVEELLSADTRASRIQQEMLNQGIKDPTSEEGLRIAAQIDAQVQREQVAALTTHTEQLKKAGEEEKAAEGRLIRLREQLAGYNEETQRQRQEVAAGVGGRDGLLIFEQQRAEGLDNLKVKIEETSIAADSAHMDTVRLTKEVEDLTKATGEYKPPTKETEDFNDKLGKQGEKLSALLDSYREQADAMNELSSQAASGERVFAVAERRAAAEREYRQQAAQLTEVQAGALAKLHAAILRVAAAEERLAGARTLAGLDQEYDDLVRTNAARFAGVAASEETRRALELEAEIREKTANAADDQVAAIEAGIRASAAEREAGAFQERSDAIDLETASILNMVDAYSRGPAAVASMTAQEERRAEIARRLAGLGKAEADSLRDDIELIIEKSRALSILADASDLSQAISDQVAYNALQREATGLSLNYDQAVRRLKFSLETERQVLGLIARGALPETVAAWRVARSELLRLQEAFQAREELLAPWRQLGVEIEGALVGAIEGFLERGVSSFEDFVGNVTAMLRRAAAEWIVAMGKQQLIEALPALGGGEAATGGTVLNAAVSSIASKLTGAGGETAAKLVAGGTQGGGALQKGATSAATDLLSKGVTTGAELVTAGSTAGGGFVVSVTEAGAILIQAAGAAGAQLAAGGTAGAAGGAVAGAAPVAGTTGGGGGLLSSVGPWLAVAAIVFAIGFSQGWWGKKGREAVGSATLGGDLEVSDAWGQNAKVILPKIREAIKVIVDTVKEIDLEVERFGEVTVEKRWKTYFVNGISLAGKTAEEIQDAIATLAIRGADFGKSVSEFVKAVITGSRALSTEQLKAEIELARTVENFGKTALEQAVKRIGPEMDAMRSELVRLLGDNLSQLAFGLQQIGAEEIRRWQERYDELTGHEPSSEELLERRRLEATLLEAERALRIADLEARVIELEGRKRIEQLQIDLGIAGLRGRQHLFNAEAQLVHGHLTVMGSLVAAGATILDVQIAALNQVIAALKAIPAIDLANVKLPGGKGAGGGKKAERERVMDELLELSLRASDLADSAIDLRRSFSEFEDWIANAKKLGIAEAQLAQARKDHAILAERELLAESKKRIERAGLGGGAGSFLDLREQFQSDVAAAWEVAAEAAIANGTRVEEEFLRLFRVLEDGFQLAVDELVSGTIESVTSGLQDWIDISKGIGEFHRRLIDTQEAFAEGRQELQDLADSMAAAGLDTSALEAAIKDLSSAEAIAIQQIGVDFIGSLTALGVSLPTEVVLELAQAQFQLAKAAAIASALALAAAGAFKDSKFTLEYILGLIEGADFDLSDFNPTPPPAPPRPDTSAVDERLREIESVRDRMADLAREWRELDLGPMAREARHLTREYRELRQEAKRLGQSTKELDDAWKVARRVFIDDALRDFERIGESPLRRELLDLVSHFDDLDAAFREIGASSSDFKRLLAARESAIADFWRQATEPLRDRLEELRREDPRRTSQQTFLSAQEEFRALVGRARAGDLDAIGRLAEAEERYREIAGQYLMGGVGTGEVWDELMGGLESVVGMVPTEMDLMREQTTSLADLVRIGNRQLAAMENLPRAQHGAYMPRGGLVYVHPGERILSPAQTAAYASLVASTARARWWADVPAWQTGGWSPGPRPGAPNYGDAETLKKSLQEVDRAQASRDKTRVTLAAAQVTQGGAQVELLEKVEAHLAAMEMRDRHRRMSEPVGRAN